MKVHLHPEQAAPVLRHCAPQVRRKLRAALVRLARDPLGHESGLDINRLHADAGQPIYRLRVGDWRIVYTLDDDVVVLRIFHRRDGYGWLADMP